jgi:N-acetyl sugar amidotransferase
MKNNKTCSLTIMDSSDPDITFDQNGVSNHVKSYQLACDKFLIPASEREEKLKQILFEIKKEGFGKEYDCIIGLSGGADSSYVAYLMKDFGLRPLAIHVDNGWNSELAVNNIENIVKKLNYDLFTYVIDWEEFKDLQLSFLKAGVVDIEMLTDNAIVVLIDQLARKYKIKYFISGTNVATEAIMPKSWFYNYKYDSLNIKSIHKRFGRLKKTQSYPILNFFGYIKKRYFPGIRTVSLLNYVDYDKKEAINILEKEIGWRDYGGKHWESKFTQFYQTYILPYKFNIDKRRAFLSCLILSGQITRTEALAEINKEIYPIEKLREDKEFIIKKFNLSETDFDDIINAKPQSHYDYPSYDYYHKKLVSIFRYFFKLKA